MRLFLRGGTPGELSILVNAQAAMLAYADATIAIVAVCLACVPLVLLMRKPTARPGPALPVLEQTSAATPSSGRGRTGVKAA